MKEGISSETVLAITNFLFIGKPEQKLKRYDLILVLGNEQIEDTADEISMLIKKNHIDNNATIVFTGNVGSLNKGSAPEALRLNEAVKSRSVITSQRIVIEDKATNSLENFKFSKPLIEEKKNIEGFNRILCICKAFLTRRAKMCAAACGYPVEKIDFYGTVDTAGKNIGADTWFQSDAAIKRVMEEIKRIAEYTLKGDLSLD